MHAESSKKHAESAAKKAPGATLCAVLRSCPSKRNRLLNVPPPGNPSCDYPADGSPREQCAKVHIAPSRTMPNLSALKSWSASQEDNKNLGGVAELLLPTRKFTAHAKILESDLHCSAFDFAHACFSTVSPIHSGSHWRIQPQNVVLTLHNSGRFFSTSRRRRTTTV